MKKILSIFTLVAALFAYGAANAQGSIHAGYVQNNLISTTTLPVIGTTYDTLSRPGAYVGFNYNIPFGSSIFGIIVGANVEYFRRSDSVVALGTTLTTRRFQQLDLVVPVYANYAIPFGRYNTFTFFAGPTLGLGLINKCTVTDRVLNKDSEINYFDNENATEEAYYRERFTWALTAGVRVNFGGFGIHAGYTHGMSDNFSNANTKGISKRIFVGANINF